MERRFVLALLLTGAVIMLTPLLFPRRPVPVTPVATDTVPGAPEPTSAPPAAAVGEVPPPAVDTGAGVQTPPAPVALAPETALGETARSRLRVSSLGGALVGAEMARHHTLGPDSSLVELVRPQQALLTFRLMVGGDTLALDRTVLARDSSPPGWPEITYRGTVRNVPVSVRWTFAPDTYTVKQRRETETVGYASEVEIRATGLGAGGYLLVDLPQGFRTTEADSATDFQHLAYAYKPVASRANLIRFGKPKPGEREIRPGPHTWAVAKSKYFMVGVLAPSPDWTFAELQVFGVPRTGRMATDGRATVVVPLRDGVARLEVYAGPQEWRRLVAMGRGFENANPYGGWMQGFIQPFATIVMRILLWMKDVLDLNYGWTLIIFGILVRVVLWPLNQTAMRSSLRMQQIQPELAAAQKKHAGNPDKQREELMRIYREHGMSPFSALSGCLPLLIPMPVLFALFFVFQNTIEFRGVSFWWMVDISQKDPFFVLPLVMGGSLFLLQWIGTRGAPPNPQMKMIMYFLPIMMTFILFNFAAGLNLYYASQNLAALPQQWLIANERAKHAKRPR